MAAITPPKKTTKGMPPPEQKPSNNLTKAASGSSVLMNFRVSPEFHREFKTYAAMHDISMVELLERCFEHYKESTK